MSETDDRGLSAMGATFAERKAAREKQVKTAEAEPKQVDAETSAVEDKAVTPRKASAKKKP